MSATIRDIAAALGISHTTVSRVLSGKGGGFISHATRDRVLKAAAEMDYRPNRVARALATGHTGLVAVWLEDLRTPYFVSVMAHVADRLRGQAWEPLVWMMESTADTVDRIKAWQIDGILALEGARFVNRLLDAHMPNCPPIVSMGAYAVDRVDHVRVDLWAAAHEATRHLIEIGCRRVALFTNAWDYPGEPRHAAYEAAILAAGLHPEVIITPDDARANARRVIAEYIRDQGCPEGLFCYDDDIAIGAYRGLVDSGVSVPAECALVGCDGLEDTEYFECPISTIEQPVDRMCEIAWQFLAHRLAQPDCDLQQQVLPARLMVRASSQR